MGRRSKMSKLRSERMHAWWQHQRAAGVQVAEKFTCEESKKSLAAVISHKSIQPKNESVSSNSGDDRASLYSAGGSDGSADFDVSPEALKRDLRDLASLNKGHGLRRRQYVRRRGSQREPLDKSIPEESTYFRVWSEMQSAGINTASHFKAGDLSGDVLATATLDDCNFLRAAAKHLNRQPTYTPFISVTSSFPFAICKAYKLRRTSQRVFISVINGLALTTFHRFWRSGDVCRKLSDKRMLKEYHYCGCFELLIHEQISSQCIVACIDFEDLLRIDQASPAVRSLLQMRLFKKSVKDGIRKMEIPSFMDGSIGHAMGFLVRLVNRSLQQPLDHTVLKRFISNVLHSYKIPGWQDWSDVQCFTDALKLDALAHSTQLMGDTLKSPCTNEEESERPLSDIVSLSDEDMLDIHDDDHDSDIKSEASSRTAGRGVENEAKESANKDILTFENKTAWIWQNIRIPKRK